MTPLAYCILIFAFYLFAACAGLRGSNDLIRPIDEAGLQQLIKEARGRIVLVNFWATWCEPCVEEFPDLVKIVREFQPLGVNIIFVTIDESEDISGKVAPFLKAQGVSFRSYMKKTKDDEIFINTIDPQWSGAIPATFIYDAHGVLAKRFVAKQNFETLAAALKSLISENTQNVSN